MAGASALQSELNSHIRVNTGHATVLFTSTEDKLPNEIKTPTIKRHLQVQKVDALFVMSTCLWRVIFSCPRPSRQTFTSSLAL